MCNIPSHGIGFASSPLPGASASPPARQHWSPLRPSVPREIWQMTRRPKVEKAIFVCPSGIFRAQKGTKTGPKSGPKVDPEVAREWSQKGARIGARSGPESGPEVDPEVARKWSPTGSRSGTKRGARMEPEFEPKVVPGWAPGRPARGQFPL